MGLNKEDIRIILLEGDGNTIIYQNMNAIFSFLKVIPDEFIKNLNEIYYSTITDYFYAWLEKMKEIRSK